ncbi:MAG: ThiF family adenylyltransferase, partial [Candidatus Nitrosotenuis sp.]
GDTTWSARIYPKPFKITWCSEVRIVGKYLTVHFNPRDKPPPTISKKLLRTKSVWGDDKQADIMRLTVGIVGAGSVGSTVGEALARIGIGKILLMDYDRIKEHNLDRMNCVTKKDIGQRKIDVVKTNLEKAATNSNFQCEISDESIVEEKGYKKALDCDVLFSCVDRPWPRQVLNHFSYSCLIPVIDGGIDFKISDGKLIHGMYRAQTAGPERPCLICLRAVDLDQVQMDRDGAFDDPEYIADMEKRTKIPTRQNIMPFVFALAGMETIHFSELVTGIGRMGDLGQQPYNYYPGDIQPIYKTCVEGCENVMNVALGDTKKPFLGTDKSKLREAKGK